MSVGVPSELHHVTINIGSTFPSLSPSNIDKNIGTGKFVENETLISYFKREIFI